MTQPTPPVDPSGSLGWLEDLADPPRAASPSLDPELVPLPNGMVVPRNAPPPVGGGTFQVDLDRAPEAIHELEKAVDELMEIREEALVLGDVTPPSADLVSRDAAQALGAVAVAGPGSLLHALEAGIQQINALIGALRADLHDYAATEADASDALRRR